MKVSGYTTTLNCIEMDYPFDLCIKSLLGFCDEVCIADGGSKDGTLEKIKDEFPQVIVKEFPVDMSDPRWAIHADGGLKNNARNMCTGDVLWHADNDEVLDKRSYSAALDLCKKMIKYDCYGVIKVPFFEFWGSLSFLRADVIDRPAISLARNNLSIGIPNYAKKFDEGDNVYCRPFDSDSCQYINEDGASSRLLPIEGSSIVVWHLSWLDFKRKIMHYKKFWNRFHKSMYNLDIEDIADNNVMFNKPWAEVNDSDISIMAKKLSKMGPRSFHNKIDEWNGPVQAVDKKEIPKEIISWAKERGIS
jgi:glycosyltransferase involved in cell wall biosynthesis